MRVTFILYVLCSGSVLWAEAPRTAPAKSSPAPQLDLIDRLLTEADAKLPDQRAAAASDLEFLRRAYLDLAGTIPSAGEARAFEKDRDPAKREHCVDQLLASQAHVWHMAEQLDIWWMERRTDTVVSTGDWRRWLRENLQGGEPLDFIVRDILSADGLVKETQPAARFSLDRGSEPNLVARDIARLFLGANLQCAQCHDHPRVEDYTQEKYQGLLAFLVRTRQMTDPKTKKMVLAEKADGETTFVSVFDKAKVQKKTGPKLPGLKEIPDPALAKGTEYIVAPAKDVREVPRYSRRSRLSETLAQGGYDPFARNMANRLWAMVMGRGLVFPLDMHHPGNPPSHPELLDHLTSELIRMQFDHRAFLKLLVLSQAYQRSSQPPSGTALTRPESGNRWRMMPLKPLGPEVFARSALQATGWTDGEKASLRSGAKSVEEGAEETLQGRMAPLMAPIVRSLKGQPGLAEEFDPRVDQVLFLGNNAHLLNLMGDRPDSLMRRLSGLTDPDAITEEIHLSVLTRHATAEELSDWRAAVNTAKSSSQPQAGFKQLIWALIASAEFRFSS